MPPTKKRVARRKSAPQQGADEQHKVVKLSREEFLKLVFAAGALKLPAPGFHAGLPLEHYLRLPAVSNSWLSRFNEAPAKLLMSLTAPDKVERPETPATKLGSAIHSAILEPDVFKSRYLRAGPCTAELASGKRKGETCGQPGKLFGSEEGWRCGQHKPLVWMSGKTPLAPEEWDCCMALRDNCLSKNAQFHNPKARMLLTLKDADVELTGVWRYGETGEDAKLRADHIADSASAATDIKSTIDASPSGFPKHFYDRRYYAQQAHYSMGYADLGRPIKHHYIVACEKEYPYLVAVYRVIDEVMELGRKEVRQLVRLYHTCMESGEWPGYPAKILDIGLPSWGERQLRAAISPEV